MYKIHDVYAIEGVKYMVIKEDSYILSKTLSKLDIKTFSEFYLDPKGIRHKNTPLLVITPNLSEDYLREHFPELFI